MGTLQKHIRQYNLSRGWYLRDQISLILHHTAQNRGQRLDIELDIRKAVEASDWLIANFNKDPCYIRNLGLGEQSVISL